MSSPARTAVVPLPAGREGRVAAAGLSGFLVIACLVRFGPGAEALVAGFFAAVLVLLSVIDLERRIIPNRIVLPATAIVLLANVARDPDRAPEWILAAVGAGLFFLVPLLVYPSGIGMGDVKLALLLGAGLGLAVVPALVVGLCAAFVVAVALLVRGGAEARKTAIPFGPLLSFGAIVALLFM